MTESPLHRSIDLATSLAWACPVCQTHLVVQEGSARCPRCETVFARQDAIWRFLPASRQEAFARFLHEYQRVRLREGWGHENARYYRTLPNVSWYDPNRAVWRLRARSFRAFEKQILHPLEQRSAPPLKLLDLGAGNGWLSYRLAQRGHHVAAVDLQTNAFDGLGAHGHYDAAFLPVQAEFDRLPFASDQFDLALFNASFHYTTNYAVTLREAGRVLKPEGQVILLDSPVYRDGSSGEAMVRERQAAFERTYGFASNAIACENYLTDARLEELAALLDLQWQFIAPYYGWRWAARPWIAKLRRRREPARFLIIVGSKRPGRSY